ncbi:efflux RND transporter periplasmic adaptor subunit [Saccharicrinis aurantiacus]|uniref:efflux RND transporter periplasmic adaptor subunit n=1 Tax=Saccharicrinis aurantiacus TaxID=1849719 RepID=UPI0024920C0A|nr:efflux RND transporter periplasmic adaptor subunit [Saccharicrinis aurantiacus]
MKTNINKRDIKLIAITMVAGLFLGWLFFHSLSSETSHNHEEQTVAEETVYTCSMHPQIKQNKPGLCPICAMDLVPMETGSIEGEHVDPNEIQMTESALALASVQTTIVKKGIPEKDVQLLGKVKADERNISELTARFGGRIEKLFINYTGQQVKKGEKLGTIYSPELITAQKELLEALKYRTSNPSFYKASRAKLKLWDLTEQQIDAIETRGETKTFFDIQSPISGTVTKRHVSIGDYVKEGSPLFEVINLSKVWVLFDAYESDLPWIKKGDDIEFTLQSVPGKQFNGKVTFIDPFIDAQTRVAQVRVELRNTDGQLKPEMFANGILKSNTAQNTNELLIPKSAILWTGKRAVVYVKVPDRETSSFIYREIVLGPEAGNFYVVSEGLSEGEEIAMNGVFKIDAAAQLAGKSSMMNPGGGQVSTGHNHGDVSMKGGNEHAGHDMSDVNLNHETFKVSGNCEMCKSTIESTAKSLPGVNVANWNIETKELHVSFDDEKSSLSDIHKAIAKSGYDTKEVIATKDAYDNLPACCQYTRATETATEANVQHETFKVSGNCGMCEETIETAAKALEGVNEADWSQETKMIHVSFNSDKVKLVEIHKAIAKAGYDTELEKADDEVYNNLHGCCQYTRD